MRLRRIIGQIDSSNSDQMQNVQTPHAAQISARWNF
jgi:hypothetical protein